MFNEFRSSDPRERKAKAEERLRIMREAREAEYYDEEGSEHVVLASSHAVLDKAREIGEWDGDGLAVVFDGVNPCDPSPTTSPFNGCAPSLNLAQVVEQAQAETEWMERASEAAKRTCKRCAGFGWITSGDDVASIFGTAQCPACEGTGYDRLEPA